tara:strand:- start:219214 stop:220080 length:867 start_codon:yes stop_codon:yes gene_type:complete
MVFTNETTATTEQWEPEPVLRYPQDVLFLSAPEDPESTTASVEPVIPVTAQPNLALGETEPAEPLLPTPFIKLPREQLEFAAKTTFLQRGGRHDILFHEAWLQPMAEADSALPIVLDNSGDTGQWPLLQGTITLHIARYLHLETNLWLNTQGEYFESPWRMPPPPLGPARPSQTVEELDTAAPQAGDVIASTTPEKSAVQESSLAASGDFTEDEELILQDLLETDQLTPLYPYRHAILLQQKRRMRSNEIHYIDHPKLGLLIKFTPLTEDDLALLARGETPPAGDQAL